MEEKKPTTGKFALTFGIILGIISIVFNVILYMMDLQFQGGFAILIINALIMLAIIIVGMRQFKKENGGFMSFGEAIKIGLGIALIAGVLGIIYQQLLINVIDPEYMQKAVDYQRAVMAENPKLTPELIDQQIEMQQKFSKPWIQMAFALVGSLFFGFILSLFPALAMKKTEQNDY